MADHDPLCPARETASGQALSYYDCDCDLIAKVDARARADERGRMHVNAVNVLADLRAKVTHVADVHQFHGTTCLCGYDSHGRSRSMTEHILSPVLDLLNPGGSDVDS